MNRRHWHFATAASNAFIRFACAQSLTHNQENRRVAYTNVDVAGHTWHFILAERPTRAQFIKVKGHKSEGPIRMSVWEAHSQLGT